MVSYRSQINDSVTLESLYLNAFNRVHLLNMLTRSAHDWNEHKRGQELAIDIVNLECLQMLASSVMTT